MDVVEGLVRARSEFENGAWVAALDIWRGVDAAKMTARDCEQAGVAAFLVGHRDEAVDALQRAYSLHLNEGDLDGAVLDAFHLSMTLLLTGEPAMGAGWAGRARRAVVDLPDDAVANGYVAFLDMIAALRSADFPAARQAAEAVSRIGVRHDEADLTALGLCSRGRLALYAGQVQQGLDLLDEAILCLTTSVVSPIAFGHVYCTAIEGCQEIADLGRVAEWTVALTAWAASRPDLLVFTGQCSLHRGQLMRDRGAWGEALQEFSGAIDRYLAVRMHEAVGLSAAERGDLLRLLGDYDDAAAAYQQAGEAGFDPQPGLALLWLATGRGPAALAAVRRLLGEGADPVHRAQRLPAAIEVLVACGEDIEAAAVADELDELAQAIGTPALLARAAYSSGLIELTRGDAGGALPYLRKARQLWASLDLPYEVARVRVLIGRSLCVMGDQRSGEIELAAAADAFRRLRAAPALAEVTALLVPQELPAGLTAREAEVLRLVAAGRSNAQVAAELVLSEKTVARHLSNIFAKLDVGSRTAAAAFAFEHGLA
jgi:DNA-binding CsgD family transcriptional regulator